MSFFALFRQGMRTLLSLDAGIEVVGEAADGMAALELFDELRPDVTLMDPRMARVICSTASGAYILLREENS